VTISRRSIVGSCAALTAAITVLTAVNADPAVAAAPAPPSHSTLQKLENAIVAAGVPGVSVEVRDSKGTWDGVAGVADVHSGRRPNAHGEIRAGSITKTFVATVVLQLAAEKRIKLDASINKYLPGLLPYKQTITIRELLQHTSGLIDYASGTALWPDEKSISTRRFRTYSPDQLIRIATKHRLLFKPGTKWSYSNANYLILGKLIGKITGRSLAAELSRRILRPLRLRHTYLAGAYPLLPHPAERGYEQLATGKPFVDVTIYNMTWAGAAAALVSTGHDLNRFYAALLTGRLLPAAQLKQLKHVVPIDATDGYGLGIDNMRICGQTVWGHVGNVPGYRTYSYSTADARRQITISAGRGLTAGPDMDAAVSAMIATEFCGTKAKARPLIIPKTAPAP